MPPCELCDSENVIPDKTWGPRLRCIDCGHIFIDWYYDDWNMYDDPEDELSEASFQ